MSSASLWFWDHCAGDTVGDLHGKDRADALNAVRQTVLAGFAGASVLLGLRCTARTYQLSRRGKVTERFSRAVGQLASERLEERLGGTGVVAVPELVGQPVTGLVDGEDRKVPGQRRH